MNRFTLGARFGCASAQAASLAILLAVATSSIGAQTTPQLQTQEDRAHARPDAPPAAHAKSAAPLPYVAEPSWVAPIFDSVDSSLKSFPPTFREPLQRTEALMLLDGPLHLDQANRYPSTHQFLMRRIEGTLASMESTRVTTGARIWKTYNHGFVVRTPSVTVGIDLVRGWHAANARFTISPSQTSRLVDQLDVLALSHNHGDHCDPVIRDAALQAGVTIVADPSIYPNTTASSQLLRPKRLDEKALEAGTPLPAFATLETSSGKKLEYLAYPGHQREILNNWYLFRTPEGFTFLHTGDEALPEDFAWISNIGKQQRVDVLLINSWASNLSQIVRDVHPKLVVLGHEAEMSHIPAQRQAYWDSYKAARASNVPALVPGWGEAIDYPLPPQTHKKR